MRGIGSLPVPHFSPRGRLLPMGVRVGMQWGIPYPPVLVPSVSNLLFARTAWRATSFRRPPDFVRSCRAKRCGRLTASAPPDMRVSIVQTDVVRGFVRRFRQIEVTIRVQFSEAEKVVIARRQLGDFIVMPRDPDALTLRRLALLGLQPETRRYDLLVSDLLDARGTAIVCDTPAHAKNYERDLVAALKSLKLFIAENEALSAFHAIEL